jgi:apolipoprotein N-acyltransferase
MAVKTERWSALGTPARLLLAAASGLAAAAAFPPLDWGPLAFVALVPLFLALAGAAPARAAWLGFAQGLAFFLAAIPWVVVTMTTYGHLPLPLSLLALVLLAAVLALYPAAFAFLLRAGETRWRVPVWLWPLLAAWLWVGLEIARTFLLSGFPWALLGYTQYRQPTVRLLAAAGGVYAISGLLVLVNAAIAAALLSGRGQRAAGLAALGLAGMGLLGAWGYARWGWQDPTGGAPVRVALLQGNIDQRIKWNERFQQETLDIYERLARAAAADQPDLIVWPETAVPFFLRYDATLGGRVLRLAREIGVPMLVGSPDQGADRLLYNSAFLVMPDATIHGRYDKRHLVPFGEYVPLRAVLFFLDKLVVGIGDFGRGTSATVFPLAGLPFGVMICYEVIFPGEVRDFARAGAGLLVNITNDAWFGRSGAPYQHLAMAALRAVENGSYLVRAANTGVTAAIAPTGEIRAATALFTEGSLLADVRLRRRETVYTRHGGVLTAAGGAFLILYSLLLAAGLRRDRGSARRT